MADNKKTNETAEDNRLLVAQVTIHQLRDDIRSLTKARDKLLVEHEQQERLIFQQQSTITKLRKGLEDQANQILALGAEINRLKAISSHEREPQTVSLTGSEAKT